MLSQEQLQKIELGHNESKLSQRAERYQYLGILDEYQLHPPSIINSFKYSKLNPYQHFLFKRVLHGLNVYKPEEVQKLHWDKRRRISKVWKRSQKELNHWKQTLCNKRINSYLRKTFKCSPLALYIANIPAEETLDDYNNTMTFKELGITYEDVILKFMSLGLLPRNFFTIKPNVN
jgi:hypothetical protein|tara:strand:- start:564 stop:1091 length:528 start_codon:yes stop_codon:yes gene_type:complete